MTEKQKYREFCNRYPDIPIFSRDWWLDAVCGEPNWDVVLVERGDAIVASLPYFKKKVFGRTFLVMPPLTQTLGPWLRPSEAKYAKQLAEQKDSMTRLIRKLPNHDYFRQNFHYSITNWLPFHWEGFSQTTRYTYVLDRLADEKKLWDGLLPNIRTDIKKARDRYQLQIHTEPDIETFLDVNELTFQRQNMALPYSRELVRKLDRACDERGVRKMFFAKEDNGKVHAVAYIVWDDRYAYYIMGGADSELRNSGATSLLMWEAIRFASTVTARFDFEGSMIEPVERFVRAFGARQVPYFEVKRVPSRMLRMWRAMKTLGSLGSKGS